MTDTPKFEHSPIHVLPDQEKAIRALQNPNHPFYVGPSYNGPRGAHKDNPRRKNKK